MVAQHEAKDGTLSSVDTRGLEVNPVGVEGEVHGHEEDVSQRLGRTDTGCLNLFLLNKSTCTIYFLIKVNGP